MRRRAAVAVCLVLLAAGCATDSSDTPATGPGGGPVEVCSILLAAGCATDSSDTPATGPGGGSVEVRPSVEPMPGATVTLTATNGPGTPGTPGTPGSPTTPTRPFLPFTGTNSTLVLLAVGLALVTFGATTLASRPSTARGIDA